MDLEKYRIDPQADLNIKDLPQWEDTGLGEEEIRERLIPQSIERLKELHLKLHAQELNGVLVVLQALDAAGKDEIITFIFSHFLPQGLKVTSMKKPSSEEKKHDFLWRVHDALPERGQVGILNRSYYEDVLALLVKEGEGSVPAKGTLPDKMDWELRCEHINQYERYLMENGFPVVKLFPYVSREVQKERLLERMKDPEKNWEFSFSDVEDREKWDQFEDAYEKILNRTSTTWAPWYALPADNPWYTRYLASEIMIGVLEALDPQFPVIEGEKKDKLNEYITRLEEEQA